MIKKLFLVLILGIAAFAVVASMQPADFRINRSATIEAPPDVVFSYCNDLHKWQEWSPWAKMDPECKITYEGPATGVGAKFNWSGNNEVGQGSMEIIESHPNELVRIKLEFLKPFQASNTVDFTLKPEASNTQLTWSMYGKNGFVGKAFSLIMSCEKMCGPPFEKGLATLNQIVKTSPPPVPAK